MLRKIIISIFVLSTITSDVNLNIIFNELKFGCQANTKDEAIIVVSNALFAKLLSGNKILKSDMKLYNYKFGYYNLSKLINEKSMFDIRTNNCLFKKDKYILIKFTDSSPPNRI